jgi:ATP adenylyltransferase
MDRLWSPWRYQYVTHAAGSTGGCLFCEKAEAGRERENLVLFRGRLNYVLLNLYPYTNGHMMVAPYQHVATLAESPEETLTEMILLTRLAEMRLQEVYRPHGVNLGMNLGECAGAGVAGHIHMHVLPRWIGDANFMTTIGETRVLPEDLATTYERLSAAFQRGSASPPA